MDDAMDIDRAPARGESNRNALERQLEHTKLSRQLAVPTANDKVKARLRELGEPITLFGESLEDRRLRLREVLTKRIEDAVANDVELEEAIRIFTEGPQHDEEQTVEQIERRVPGGPELLAARRELTRYTLLRAKKRLEYQKIESKIDARKHVQQRSNIKTWLNNFEIAGSQVYGPRITSALKFSPDGQNLAVGTWGGRVALLNNELEEQIELRGNSEAPVAISWTHGALLGSNDDTRPLKETLQEYGGVYLATGDSRGMVRLFAGGQMEDESLVNDDGVPFTRARETLEGHTRRVSSIEFFPSNKYMITGSHDETWRLWNLEKSVSVLTQKAHSREVQCMSLNVDGSLLATGGMDSYARIWDMRTGNMILEGDGHVQPVYSVSWSPNGYRFMSGSADGLVKVWDMRKMSKFEEIPAHLNGVSGVKWFNGLDGPLSMSEPPKDSDGTYKPKIAGTFFITVGFDKQLKLWSADDWQLVAELGGHTGNITCVDVTNDARSIATASRDMSIKLWGQPDETSIYDHMG